MEWHGHVSHSTERGYVADACRRAVVQGAASVGVADSISRAAVHDGTSGGVSQSLETSHRCKSNRGPGDDPLRKPAKPKRGGRRRSRRRSRRRNGRRRRRGIRQRSTRRGRRRSGHRSRCKSGDINAVVVGLLLGLVDF